MNLRGFGDVLGFQQSGIKNFKLADPVHHKDLFIIAEKNIREIELNEVILKNMIFYLNFLIKQILLIN